MPYSLIEGGFIPPTRKRHRHISEIIESQGDFQIDSMGSVEPDKPLMPSKWSLTWPKIQFREGDVLHGGDLVLFHTKPKKITV